MHPFLLIPLALPSCVSGVAMKPKARCGIHALNNCLGREFVTDDDMEYAIGDYLENSQRESLIETRGANAKATGWYSIALSIAQLAR